MQDIQDQNPLENQPAPVAGRTAMPKREGIISMAFADGIGVVSSLAVAAATGWSRIKSHAYKNISSLGEFDDMKPARKAARESIEHKVQTGQMDSTQAYKALDELIEVNEREAEMRLERLGVRTTADRWHLLRKHQKVETLMEAFAVGGVALGSILLFSRSFKDLENQEKDTDSRGR